MSTVTRWAGLVFWLFVAAASALAIAIALFENTDKRTPIASSPTRADPPAPALPTFEDRLTPRQKADCGEFGKLAGQMAARRNEGATLDQELASIRRLPNADAIRELANVAQLVYQHPAFNRQTPQSEAISFAMDCEMKIGKTQAGAQYFNTADEIAVALSGFKTFNGVPLVQLLGKYGIWINYAEAVPAEFFAPIPCEKGELVYSMMYGKGASRRMPCKLRDEFTGQALPVTEFIRRGDAFPLVRPDEDDPLIYWAATGKCQS
jgi:hypothetical protein